MFFMVGGVICILVGCLFFIPRFPFGPYTLYGNMTAEQRAAKIPFESLNTEVNMPVTVLGNQPKAPKWISAIKKFPDVRSCLVASEKSASEPDLRLINWDSISTQSDANVCLWRIFQSFGGHESIAIDRIRAWMKFHGKPTLWDPKRTKTGVKHLQMFWDLETNGAMYPTHTFSQILSRVFGHGARVNASWDKDGNLKEVSASVTTK